MNTMPAPRADVPNDALIASDEYRNKNLNYDHINSHNITSGCYGIQRDRNPYYQRFRPSSSEYGWFPPTTHTSATCSYPLNQRFSSRLAQFGMYRNNSLNTAPDPRPMQ